MPSPTRDTPKPPPPLTAIEEKPRELSIADAFFTALAHASGDVDEDLPHLLQIVAESLEFEVATMWWWRHDEGVLRCEHVWQAPGAGCETFLDLTLESRLRPGEPVPGTVFEEQNAVWVPDVRSYPNFRRGPAASAAGLRSGVAFPIRARDEAVGVFELFTLDRRESDAPLLEVVANAAAHLGDFIERLNVHAHRDRLLVDLEVARRRLEFLLDASHALSTTRGLDETIARLATVAVPAIGDLCLIDVVGREGTIERLTAFHSDRSLTRVVDELRRFPPDIDGDHPAATVIRSGTSLVAHDMPRQFLASTTQSTHHYELTRQLHFTSYLSVPLLGSDGPIGALTVVSAGSGRRFGDGELELVEELAAQVTSVIERERRFDEQRYLSHILQRSMLPEVESPDGLEVAARYLGGSEGTEVGGDFYDVVQLDETTVALIIGDVQGHDLVATTAMAQVRSALRAFLQMTIDPNEVLSALDRYVAQQPERRFVTVALAFLDVITGELTVTSAGHPAPLLLIDGEVVPIDCRPRPPAGIGYSSDEQQFDAAQQHLPAGGSILLYTDGLVEGRTGGCEARLPALSDAFRRYRDAPLTESCDALIEETLAGATPEDDVAVLWVRRP